MTQLIKESSLSGKRIGYIRVSSFEQNLDQQLEDIQVDRLFEGNVSGDNTKRPELKTPLNHVREGILSSFTAWTV